MVSCAACGYSHTPKNKNLGITFHSFPKDSPRREVWASFVKKLGWEPKSTSKLCSCHFTEENFDYTSKLQVRLVPTALPTIEVDRVKYVRTFNPIQRCILAKKQKKSDDLFSEPEPSCTIVSLSPTPTTNLSQSTGEETHRKKTLKRKIAELDQKDALKSKKVRQLQKLLWRKKRQISSLKSMVTLLKKQNFLSGEHENIIFQHFGSNTELIEIKNLNVGAHTKNPEQIINESVPHREEIENDNDAQFIKLMDDHDYAL